MPNVITGFPSEETQIPAREALSWLSNLVRQGQEEAARRQALADATPTSLTGGIADAPRLAPISLDEAPTSARDSGSWMGDLVKQGQAEALRRQAASEAAPVTLTGSAADAPRPAPVNLTGGPSVSLPSGQDLTRSYISATLGSLPAAAPLGAAINIAPELETAAKTYAEALRRPVDIPPEIANAYTNEYGTPVPDSLRDLFSRDPSYMNRVLNTIVGAQGGAPTGQVPMQQTASQGLQGTPAVQNVPAVQPAAQPTTQAVPSPSENPELTDRYGQLINAYLQNLAANTSLTNEQAAQIRENAARIQQEEASRRMSPADYVTLGLRNVFRALTLQPTMTTDLYKQEKYAPRREETLQDIQARRQALNDLMANAMSAQSMGSQGLHNLQNAMALRQTAQLAPIQQVQNAVQLAMSTIFSPEEQAKMYKEGKLSEVQSRKLALALQQAQVDAENAQTEYTRARAEHPELFVQQPFDFSNIPNIYGPAAPQGNSTSSSQLNPPANK